MATKICIIGCGTYGSYLIRGLMEKFGNDIELTVIEMGNEKTQNESEIGITAESGGAQAAEKGRYFGLGGTSARWGGQVLFFDERDNPTNDKDWTTIVNINKQYRSIVLQKLLGNVPKFASLSHDKGIEKTGIWLKYTKRNIFKSLDKTVLNPIRLLKNQRVTGFAIEDNTIKAVTISGRDAIYRVSRPAESQVPVQLSARHRDAINRVSTETIEADIFYLTAGAIESCRLLLTLQEQHHLITSTDLGKHYGDHLSVELFKIKGHKPIIKGIDLLPTFINGSLITKRLIVADNKHRIGFAHPIFNKEVNVFTSIKRLLFGKQQVDFNVKDVLDGFVFLIRFGFSVVFLKKMYAHRNNWSLQLDIEQAFPNKNTIELSENKDEFGQKTARLNWQVSAEDKQAIETIKTNLKTVLDTEGIPYSVVYDPNVAAAKIEDVYHPVGFIRMGHEGNAVLDLDYRVKGLANLYHFSTAMFPSAKSINPTAAVFCLIEDHLAQLHDVFETHRHIEHIVFSS